MSTYTWIMQYFASCPSLDLPFGIFYWSTCPWSSPRVINIALIFGTEITLNCVYRIKGNFFIAEVILYLLKEAPSPIKCHPWILSTHSTSKSLIVLIVTSSITFGQCLCLLYFQVSMFIKIWSSSTWTIDFNTNSCLLNY